MVEIKRAGGQHRTDLHRPNRQTLPKEIKMLISGEKITMSVEEGRQFMEITLSKSVPRTIREFNALAELGAARHMIENTGGAGWMHAFSCEEIKFGEDGTANFPADQRRLAYVKVHGTWPSDDELADFESTTLERPTSNVASLNRG